MLRMTPFARRKSPRAFGPAMAAALAFAGAAGFAVPGAAQGQPAAQLVQPQVKASKNFGKLYQPVADVANAAAGDYAAAKAQLPAVVAAIQSADDRYLAGNLTVVLGNKLNDPTLQRQGLELMIASGKADPATTGQYQWLLGQLVFQAHDYAAARTAFLAAAAAGQADDRFDNFMAQTYYNEGGSAALRAAIEQRAAAGQDVPENWLLYGLAKAYEAKQQDEATQWSALLVAHKPTAENWNKALLVVNQLNQFTPKVQLDLLRLMAATNTLKDRAAYEAYVEAVDPRIMATEASRVLDAGLRAGAFSATDSYYTEAKTMADSRAASERGQAEDYAAHAQQAATGREAKNAGDLYLGLQSYAEAEQMFQLALQKGGVDRDEALTRLGIAQVQQGKAAEAKATFAQVSGARAPVAQLWAAYAQSRASA